MKNSIPSWWHGSVFRASRARLGNPRRKTFPGLCILAVALAFHAGAFQPPKRAPMVNIDQRQSGDAKSRESAEQKNAAAALQARVPKAKVDFDTVVGAPKFIASTDGFLTGPDGEGKGVSGATAATIPKADPHRATKAFLKDHSALFGHGPEVLTKAKIKREFTTAASGMKTVVWEQQVDGIPVFEAVLISHTTRRGELINLASQFVPDPEAAAARGTPDRAKAGAGPSITAAQAVALAAANLGDTGEAKQVSAVAAAATTPDKQQKFTAPFLRGESDTRLTWVPMSKDMLRLCWDVVLTGRERPEMYRVLVDAHTGEVVIRRCLTAYLTNSSYRVYTSDSPSPFSPGHPTPMTNQPPLVPRVLVTLPALNTNGSPLGWIDDAVNETRGNNVDAHTDLNDDNAPDLPRPAGAPFHVFDFPMNLLTDDPGTYRSAAVVQLFYTCNWMHDKLYELGFTEAAGNFQNSNFGRGGLGNDALQADAQDGGGTDNANMSTPPDGTPPRMQMYVFSGATPRRDGDFDAEIVLHEYTHGLSNRRVGGGVGISALQSAGMGEGWSDWYGLTLLAESGDNINANYAAGGYATYQLSSPSFRQNYYYGIRRYPYSTDMTKNPLTFKDIDPAQASTHPGVPVSPIFGGGDPSEVHNQGELWCVTLWDLRANLITKHGFAVGNQLALQLVTDAMNLSPADPNFLQARDAIIQSDLALTGGANRNELWAAFAKRGMGANATSPPSSTTSGVRESFDLPDDLSIRPQAGFIASGPVGGPFAPDTTTFILTNNGAAPLTWTLGNTCVWLNVSLAGGVLTPGGPSASVEVTLNATATAFPMGVYFATVRFTNLTSGISSGRDFILRVGQPDNFTELFDAADNDLAYSTITFTPNGSTSFYAACREPAAAYPTDPTGSTVVVLSDDDVATLTLTGTNTAAIYNRRRNTLYVGSNGYITMDNSDTEYVETLNRHFTYPRISALFDDLDPSAGGTLSWKQLSNRVAVTWHNVPQYGGGNGNQFQIEAFFDGRIRLTWLALASRDGLAGLSAGLGVPVAFQETDLSALNSCTASLLVSVPTNSIEGAGVLLGQGRVRLPVVFPTNFTVNLASSNTNEVRVPPSVTVTAGQTNAAFDVTIIDDALLDGTQVSVITASAPGFGNGTATIGVHDNESTTLTLLVPASVREGTSSTQGVVRLGVAPAANVSLKLSSSDSTEIQVPPSVLVSAGQTSAVFNITIVDDALIDGPQSATLTAHVENWTNGTAAISVLDNEALALFVMLPGSALETAGLLTNAGAVQLSGALPTNLVVSMASSDLSEAIVPASATIVAGQVVGTFNITLVDDLIVDGAQQVTVTASAAGWTNGSATMTVLDDESPPVPFNPTPPHLALNVPASTDLAWDNGRSGVTNDVYLGTNPVPGASELLGSTTNNTWDLPLLAPNTTYYWQIVARKIGTTPGPVWRFTTRGVDHIEISAVPSPQVVNQPFGVTVTARDELNRAVTNYAGPAALSASGGGGALSNTILPSPFHTSSSSGNWTLGYSFTPNTNLTVTAVRHYFGTKVSIWTDGGVLVAAQPVASISGTWLETPLATPVQLTAGTRYRVGSFTANGNYYWRTDPQPTFPHGTINQGYESPGDTFPVNQDGERWFVDLRYTVGSSVPLAITPTNTGAFTNGVWSGSITVFSRATNAILRAEDTAGRVAQSNPFHVVGTNQPPVILTQPASQTVTTGATVNLAVSALGTPPLTYRWMHYLTVLAGQTNATLTITNVGTNDTGNYTVLITNLFGSAVSAGARLDVIAVAPFFDDFDPDIHYLQWSNLSATVRATNYGGSVSGANSLWFGGETERFAITRAIDTRQGGTIDFHLRIADGGGEPWEEADLPDEGIVLEYANDALIWTQLGRFDTPAYRTWTHVELDIPLAAQTAATQFRWRQLSHSGACCDHWAIDDTSVNTGPRPPAIRTQPANQIAVVGGPATFSAVVSGSEPLWYQWRREGTNIAGATNAAYTILNAQSNHVGNYSVTVTNLYGSATSSNATLTVLPVSEVVAIYDNPAFVDTTSGGVGAESDNVQATVNLLGYPLLTFTNIIAAATNYGQLLLPEQEIAPLAPALTPAERGALSNFVVAGGKLIVHGNYTGASATLLNTLFNFGLQEVNARGSLTRSAEAASTEFGDAPLSIPDLSATMAFTRGSLPIGTLNLYTNVNGSGVVLIEYGSGFIIFIGWDWYDAAPIGAQNGGWHNVLASALRQGPLPPRAPTIVSQPVNRTAVVGGNAAFTIGAVGSAPLFYQWRKQGTNVPGATNASYMLVNVQTEHAGSYSAVVSNAFGAATSSNAVLTVNTSAVVSSIILFSDNSGRDSFFRPALLNLGFSFDYYDSAQEASFNAAVAAADPNSTLVIFDAPGGNHSFTTVINFITAGGRVVLAFWDLDTFPALAAALQVNVMQDFFSPQPVYDWGGSPLFDGVTSPITFVDYYNDNGDRLQPTGSAYAAGGFSVAPAAGFAAIVIGNSERTIVNGFLPIEAFATNDMVKLAENEILFLSGPGTNPPSFSLQPASQSVLPGSSVSFTARVSGSSPLSLQWRRNGTNLVNGGRIGGATSQELVIVGCVENDSDVYSLYASNAFGTATSSNASLLVSTLDHFSFAAIASPQVTETPFAVNIQARDAANTLVTNFTGTVALSGGLGYPGAGTNLILNPSFEAGVASWSASQVGSYGNTINNGFYGGMPTQGANYWYMYTFDFSFMSAGDYARTTQTVDMTGLGSLTFDAALFAPGGWQNRVKGEVRIDGVAKWTQTAAGLYTNQSIDISSFSGVHTVELRSEVLVSGNYGMQWVMFDNFRTALGNPIAVAPGSSGSFSNGVWNGNVSVLQPATNMYLLARDIFGHTGVSTNFDVLLDDDLSVTIVDSPDPVAVGAVLTNVMTVLNSGPSVATGVLLTNFLPPTASFVSATASQGSCALVGGRIECGLGTIVGGASATVVVRTVQGSAGVVTNRVAVARGEADGYSGNNSAATSTAVQAPTVVIADASGLEGNGGLSAMVFNVRLSPASFTNVSMNFTTQNGTAFGGIDYISTNGVLTFGPGETNKAVTVYIVGDGTGESTETFYVTLSAPTNATLVDWQAVGTIYNDDAPPDVYLRSSTSAPWGSTANETAMSRAFGTNNWQDLRFQTVVPANLFTPATRFIYMEGSDATANDLQFFLTSNIALIENWVAAGGRLFLNAAPNVGAGMSFGFGVTLIYSDSTSTANAAAPAHRIFAGPFTPVGLSWTGTSFGHATVIGAGLTNLIVNAGNGHSVLAEKRHGAGLVLFGGMTTDNFHSPQPQAANLRANILAYTATVNFCSNCPPTILSQSQGITVRPGSNVTFTVNVSGTAPFTYRWRRDGTNLTDGPRISGSASSALSIASVVEADSGLYSVLVSNAFGTAISSNILLAVNALDHFTWSLVPSPQLVNQPFPVSIQARDFSNALVTNFTGAVSFSALTGTGPSNSILAAPLPNNSSAGSFTLGYSFTPATNIMVTAVRSYFGSKVSVWTDGGTLLAEQAVAAGEGAWSETPLATPVVLTAGTRYRVGAYTSGGNYYWRTDGASSFPQGTVHQSYNGVGDAFPNSADGVRWWFVDLRYTVGPNIAVPVIPITSGSFTGGVWSGSVTVLGPATNMILRADNGAGRIGQSNPFQVIPSNQPPVIISPPVGRQVWPGSSVSFSVSVFGAPPLAYEWRRNGVALVNETNATLTLTGVTTNEAGAYSVLVTNQFGSATSVGAALTILVPSSVVAIYDNGSYVDTTSGGVGAESDNIQATVQGLGFSRTTVTDLSTAVNAYSRIIVPEQEINPLAPGLSQSARVAVSNFVFTGGKLVVCGTSTGAGADLLNALFNFSVVEVSSGGAGHVRGVEADGTEFGDDAPAIADNNAMMLLTRASLPANALSIYTNAFGSAVVVLPVGDGFVIYLGWDWYNAMPAGTQNGGWSGVLESALLQGPISPGPAVITQQPLSRSVGYGVAVTFAVGVSGSPPFTYQWRKDGTNLINGGRISGANGAALTITNVMDGDAGIYSVVVSNALGSATSSNATLQVTLLDHFTWTVYPSTQATVVRIEARDFSNRVVTNFVGPVNLSGVTGGVVTNTILSFPTHTLSSSGNFTLGYSFTPNSNMTVTAVRHYFGTKVSIWTDTGVLLATQSVTSVAGTWRETPLANPIQLTAGTRYRVAVYTAGGTYYYRNDLGTNFSFGNINQSFDSSGDAFPQIVDSVRWWFVDLRYSVATAGGTPVPVSPPVSGAFVAGVWQGLMWAPQVTSNVVVRADDGAGHFGLSPMITLYQQAPLAFAIQPADQAVLPGTNVTLSALAIGAGPVRYQWRHEGTNLPNATNATYSFTGASLEEHGNYSVEATDGVNTITSSNAFIFVLVRPGFVQQPQPVTVLQGQSATFTVIVTGAPPMYFRWIRGGLPYVTNTLSTLILTNNQVSTTIRVSVTNLTTGPGGLTSATVPLTVLSDNDGDGMADLWEVQYGFNTNNAADALFDFDGDGMINRDEYIADTIPTDPLSVLKLMFSGTNIAVLHFVAQTNLGYTLQYRTNLNVTNWMTLTNIPPVPSQVRTVEVNAPNPPPESIRFYRVATPRTP